MAKYKLYCWNINSIRSFEGKRPKVIDGAKGFLAWIERGEIDVLALQETKMTHSAMSNRWKYPRGYYSDWNIFDDKRAYSGVATFYKKELGDLESEVSLGKSNLDQEGRILTTKFKEFTLLNVYFPNGKRSEERLEYKFKFHDVFTQYCNELMANGEKLIVCGDVNIAHKEIDLANPKPNSKFSGFLPDERKWVDEFLDLGFIDSLRHIHGEVEKQYTWWSNRAMLHGVTARARNVGWRIDYFLVDKRLQDNIKDANIHTDIMGSDHCPISLDLEF